MILRPSISALLVAAMALPAGCSLISLDDLDDGTGGAGVASSVSATTTAVAGGTTSGAAVTSSSDSSSGNATSVNASAGSGGEGGGGGATSTGAGACTGDDVIFCDDFDVAPELSPEWACRLGFEVGSSCGLVTDPIVSPPHAAHVHFGGPDPDPDDGEEGGFAELQREIDGDVQGIAMTLSMGRDSMNLSQGEGVLEIGWGSVGNEYNCLTQILMVGDPPLLQLFAHGYGALDDAAFGEVTLELPEGTETNLTWMDVGVDITLGADPSVALRFGEHSKVAPLDTGGASPCDDGAEPGTFHVSFGAVYDYEPVDLYFDDIVVRRR